MLIFKMRIWPVGRHLSQRQRGHIVLTFIYCAFAESRKIACRPAWLMPEAADDNAPVGLFFSRGQQPPHNNYHGAHKPTRSAGVA